MTVIAGGFAGLVVALASAATAHADPSPAQLEAQIDAEWNQLEPTIEKHNAVSDQLQLNKQKVAQLTAQIRPLQEKVDAAMAKVSEIAVEYYKTGPASTFNALLSSGSATTFADQISTLNMIARGQEDAISDVAKLKEQYDAQKKPLDDLVAQLAKQESDLATQQATINAEIKRLNDLRLAAYGAGGVVGSLSPMPCPVNYPGGAAGIAVKFACQQIGKSYVWGAAGPNTYDCSGLTMAAWAKAGVRLPHNAAAQKSSMSSVSRANLRPGDLVFYYGDIHHVGMYIGGGWVVHAPHPGDHVRMAKMASIGTVKGYAHPG